MLVMILQRVSPGARGMLSRWLLEPQTGVFVGDVSAMVRDRLWERCCKEARDGAVMQIWSTNTEQGYAMRTHGRTRREVVEYQGLQLIRVPHPAHKRTGG